jgi:hypothetical protein
MIFNTPSAYGGVKGGPIRYVGSADFNIPRSLVYPFWKVLSLLLGNFKFWLTPSKVANITPRQDLFEKVFKRFHFEISKPV